MTVRSRTLVAALATAVTIGVPQPASAAAARTTVTATSAVTAESKAVTVTCPAGFVATGARALIAGDPYGVHITEVWPANRSVRVTAEVFAEVTPKPAWALTVTGTCVAAPAGYQIVLSPARVADRLTDDGSRFGELTTALCPAGKELIGMGGRATGGFLDEFQPVGQGVPYTNDFEKLMHGVRVLGRARPGAPTNAAVRSTAICAAPGSNATFGFAETHDKTAVKTVTATCPVGTQVNAAGWIMFYPNHFADRTTFSYATVGRAAAPNNSPTSLQLVAKRHQDTVATEEWGLVPEILCAR